MKAQRAILALIVGLQLGSPVWAQQNEQDRPTMPESPLSADVSGRAQDPDEITVADDRPLSGAQQLTIGYPGRRLNLLTPSFRLYAGFPIAGGDLTTAHGGFSGSLDLRRRTRLNELGLAYVGGAFFEGSVDRNVSFHVVNLSEAFRVGRWTLLVADSFSYTPESTFNGGYGGVAGLGNADVLGNASLLQQNFLPNQSIITPDAARISNSATGQVQYNLSRRTAITAAGSYGLLHPMEDVLFDTKQAVVSGGISHVVNARNLVSISYTYTRFWFDLPGDAFATHSVNASYARRLTGRLMWTVSGGTSFQSFEHVGLGGNEAFWGGSTTLMYRMKRMDVSASYFRGVTGGSGLFLGAHTDAVQAGIARPLGRRWSFSAVGGFARNTSLQTAAIPGQVAFRSGQAELHSIYGGFDVRREVARRGNVILSYHIDRQTGGGCTGPSCAISFRRHMVSIGFDWGFRPIRLQ